MDPEEARGNTGSGKEKVQLSHFNPNEGEKEEQGQRVIKDGSRGHGVRKEAPMEKAPLRRSGMWVELMN